MDATIHNDEVDLASKEVEKHPRLEDFIKDEYFNRLDGIIMDVKQLFQEK